MEYINSIINYIEFLKKEKNFSVTIHVHKWPNSVGMHSIRKYTSHDNPYCTYIKQTNEVHWRCLKCQRKAYEKCASDGSFAGICHAGVLEYTYPIIINGNTVGILGIGGYKSDNGHEYISRISDEYCLDIGMLTATYQSLNPSVPNKEYLDTLVAPLLSMLELLSYKQGLNIGVKKSLFERILDYLNYNYTKKITVENICKKFYCSRSYVAHTFKREMGKSLPEYINSLRIESAKNMLKNSNMSIVEIASATGFEDRSYFSKCFTKETGMSPKQWRQKNKKI